MSRSPAPRDVASLDDPSLAAGVAQLERQISDERDAIAPARTKWFFAGVATGLAVGLMLVVAVSAFLGSALGHSGMGGG